MHITDKDMVEQRFAQHYQSYNQQAVVQRRIAERLAVALAAETGKQTHFEEVLEVGCGTGFLTQQLLQLYTIKQYHLNDLCTNAYSELCKQDFLSAGQHTAFLPGDAEQISLPGRLDAYVSSSAMQWFVQLELFLARVHQLLNTNGWMAFSTFGTQNFHEIKNTLHAGLAYKTTDQLHHILAPNYEVMQLVQWQEKIWFNTPVDVLRHTQLTGVNGVERQYIGPRKLAQFSDTYRQLYSNSAGEVSLTFHPILVIARKK